MIDLSGMPILVTGAAGFIGANLTRALISGGADVHIIVRQTTDMWRLREVAPTLTIHQGDLIDREGVLRIVDSAKPSLLFHLAAPSGHPSTWHDYHESLRSVVLATAYLLEAVEQIDCRRFVHIGSSLEYGPRSEPLQETDLPLPVTRRGAAKASAAILCQQAAFSQRCSTVVLRVFSVYGPWEGAARLIPTAILSMLRGEEIRLTESGYRRDLTYVSDVVDACLLAAGAEGSVGEIINVGSGKQWTNEDVVDMIQAIVGKRVPIRRGVYPERCSDTTFWVADNQKAQQMLRWKPRISLRDGLERTVAWFRTHHHEYP